MFKKLPLRFFKFSPLWLELELILELDGLQEMILILWFTKIKSNVPQAAVGMSILSIIS